MKIKSYKYNEFKDYQEYINMQIGKSKRTRFVTKGGTYKRRRKWIYDRMKELKIKGETILCLGARDKSEVIFFEEKGFQADGIDLYSSEKIIVCDMSKLLKHEYFKNKKYDIIFAHDSLEHCLDFKGLLKGINKLCRKYFICLSPIFDNELRIEPGFWDCNFQSFMVLKNVFDEEIYKKCLLDTFKEFDIVYNKAYKSNMLVFFILRKKNYKEE